ncbi:rhodopsin, GQ-coupled-like [Lytechinus variegatus]|uniref:rhodopsin, GQ-coupled-like n=1 Tax=Lytechinus variegatus TaxID=7654 RepID=UPI001BB23A64|nr:rhodopsin, GQ-coupled-like [Lytechinus variegatus]
MDDYSSSTISGDQITIHPSGYIIPASFLILISITGIAGNGLTILSVFLSTKLRTKTNVFVVNLAFGDLIICLCIPGQVASLLSPHEPLVSDIFTDLIGIVTMISMYNTISTLAVVAFMKCVRITKPSSVFDDLFTKRRISLIVSVSWAFPAVYLFTFFYVGGMQFDYDRHKKLFVFTADEITPLLACYIFEGAYTILSLSITVISYVKIILYVRANTRRVADLLDVPPAALQNQPPIAIGAWNQEPAARQRPNQMADNVRAREIKVTKNLALVTAVFFLCFLPFPFVPYSSNPYLYIAGVCVVWCNSAMNPLIYSVKHPDFRKTG